MQWCAQNEWVSEAERRRDSSFFQIWVPSFQDSDGDGYGDMQGVIDRLENLRKSGVQVSESFRVSSTSGERRLLTSNSAVYLQTVWPVPFLISDNYSNAIRSFDQMDPAIGVNQLADRAIAAVHDKGIRSAPTFPLRSTSGLF